MRNHTSEKGMTLQCNQCPKVFPNNSLFEILFRTDSGEGCIKSICSKCAKEFLSYEERKILFQGVKKSSSSKGKNQNKIFEVF